MKNAILRRESDVTTGRLSVTRFTPAMMRGGGADASHHFEVPAHDVPASRK